MKNFLKKVSKLIPRMAVGSLNRPTQMKPFTYHCRGKTEIEETPSRQSWGQL